MTGYYSSSDQSVTRRTESREVFKAISSRLTYVRSNNKRGIMEKFVKLKKLKRKRKHGFLSRTSKHTGRKVIARRRNKKRKKLNV